MTYISAEMRQQVYARAVNCCEYCRINEADHYIRHEVDHVISIKHRGETILNNLCLSCLECNRYKGTDIGSLDIETDVFTPLFNPRTMRWDDHFELNGAVIMPKTAVGRVSEFLLRLNTSERLARRQGLLARGRYPCRSQ